MVNHLSTPFEGRITATHVYALGEGAVVTTSLLLTQEQRENFTLKPGDEIDVHDTERINAVRCRILDIESIATEPEHVLIRLTLEKAAV